MIARILCRILGHDFADPRDTIQAAKRDRSGELVELTFSRSRTCRRCGFVEKTAVPPDEIPADIFERVEMEIRERRARAGALDPFELDFGTKVEAKVEA